MKKAITMITVILCIMLFVNCGDDDNNQNPKTDPILVQGLTYGISTNDFLATDMSIVEVLENAGPISIVAQVNHADNAASVNEELDSTKVVLFGNPQLGTPLMQKNQLTGLDLPQKLFIWKDAENVVRIGYNDVSYLRERHGLGDLPELGSIENALANFVEPLSNNEIFLDKAVSLSEGEGIITKVSTNTFEETYTALVNAIEGNDNLRLIATLDHQANAASVNLELNPTRLIVFGNPNLGTPLMQNAQTTGIDLPQKFLVWEDENGEVKVSYNDPAFLVARHNISGNEDILATITGALDNLSNAAAGL